MYLSLKEITLMMVKEQFMGIDIKQMLVFSIIAIILVNIFIYIYTLITHEKISWSDRFFIILLVIYVCFMYMITIDKREPGNRNEIHLMLDFGNLRGDYLQIQQAVYCLLNFVFFIPLGVILSILQKRKKFFCRIGTVIIQSFFASMIIEILQLITRRGYFETTDIVINTAGGFVGGLFAAMVIAVFSFKNRE